MLGCYAAAGFLFWVRDVADSNNVPLHLAILILPVYLIAWPLILIWSGLSR